MTSPMFIMNRNDLAKRISEEKGVTKAEANEIVKSIFDQIAEELAQGNAVNISGFGKFEVRNHAGREGVNPSTGEKMQIETTKLPTFKAAKALKDSIAVK